METVSIKREIAKGVLVTVVLAAVSVSISVVLALFLCAHTVGCTGSLF